MVSGGEVGLVGGYILELVAVVSDVDDFGENV